MIMDYTLILAWAAFICGYCFLVVPIIGSSFTASGSQYGEDFLMGAKVHVGLFFILLIILAVGTFAWSIFYLLEFYINLTNKE